MDGWGKQASKFLYIPSGRAPTPVGQARIQFHQDQTHVLIVHETQIAICKAPKLECIKQDPWWNPALEEQAIMRIHRIGQKRTVHVRRLIVKDTVEHRLQQIQARKLEMNAGALTDEEVRSARIEELKMFFT